MGGIAGYDTIVTDTKKARRAFIGRNLQREIAAMQAGDLDVTVFQDAAGQGKGALDAALKLVKGDKVEKKVYIPFELVTPENLKDYQAKN